MKRRDFLRNTALTGAGLMSGCMRNQPSGVIFKGWPYEPNLVQENIDFFTDQTKIDVTYQSIWVTITIRWWSYLSASPQ